ncbi:MAG: polysaccharide biosynthesis/export family protein [Planctomycetota bacterium]
MRVVKPGIRFTTANLLFLMVGIAIGFTLNTQTLRLLAGIAANEKFMTKLPLYKIEPPDVVLITAVDEYRNRIVEGEHLVSPDGSVNLGEYGQVLIGGKTIAEATSSVRDVISPSVSVTLNVVSSDIFGNHWKKL